MWDSKLLQSIIDAIDTAKASPDLVTTLSNALSSALSREARERESEEARLQAIPIQVPDFKSVASGTIVTRSAHWKKEACQPYNAQIGILSGRDFYEDALNGLAVYPVVHWENEPFPSTVHPINVAVKNSNVALPTVTIDNSGKGKLIMGYHKSRQ